MRLPMLLLCTAAALHCALPAAYCATYHVAQTAIAADTSAGTAAAPFRTVSKAADLAVPGDTVVVHAGTYREWVQPRNSGTKDAPITYQAAPGEKVVITGADLMTGWTKDAAGPAGQAVYRVPWTCMFIVGQDEKGKPIEHHPGDDYHKLAGRAEQVIVDGKLVAPVLTRSEMKPGTFCPDTTAKILYLWLADNGDPSAHKVEAATRGLIFGTNPWIRPKGHDYLRVKGFTFRYCANFAQRGAVWLFGENDIIEDCTIEWTSGAGVGVGGHNAILRRCTSQYNGHTGGCANGDGFLMEDCVIAHNTRKAYDRGWDCGGSKICLCQDGTIRRCKYLSNGGTGLWFDIDARNIRVTECDFRDNEGCGVFVEISRGIHIDHCLATGNGPDEKLAGWPAGGFCLAESRDCVIEDNRSIGNRCGITMREQGPRGFDGINKEKVVYHCENDTIRRNVCEDNRLYQLGLWMDNGYFGRHPAQVNMSEDEWQKFLAQYPQYDPRQQHFTIDGNTYRMQPGQKLALIGCPWRAGHKEYDKLADLTRDWGFDAHSKVVTK